MISGFFETPTIVQQTSSRASADVDVARQLALRQQRICRSGCNIPWTIRRRWRHFGYCAEMKYLEPKLLHGSKKKSGQHGSRPSCFRKETLFDALDVANTPGALRVQRCKTGQNLNALLARMVWLSRLSPQGRCLCVPRESWELYSDPRADAVRLRSS